MKYMPIIIGILGFASLVGALNILYTHLLSDPKIIIDSNLYHAKSFSDRVKFLIIHYTAGNFHSSIKELTGPQVSAHYVVSDVNSNHVYQLVPEKIGASHAGVSYWKGYTKINFVSIGIEIVNLGFKDNVWHPFPQEQIETVIALSKKIILRHHIKPQFVLGHSDIAPGRKIDPGALFPWKRLHDRGIGAWYKEDEVQQSMSRVNVTDIKAIQEKFEKYGYKIPVNGILDQDTRHVIESFQMHFRPTNYSGELDPETVAILESLLRRYD